MKWGHAMTQRKPGMANVSIASLLLNRKSKLAPRMTAG